MVIVFRDKLELKRKLILVMRAKLEELYNAFIEMKRKKCFKIKPGPV